MVKFMKEVIQLKIAFLNGMVAVPNCNVNALLQIHKINYMYIKIQSIISMIYTDDTWYIKLLGKVSWSYQLLIHLSFI